MKIWKDGVVRDMTEEEIAELEEMSPEIPEEPSDSLGREKIRELEGELNE